jgi:lysophospholipase L1-like esterase
MTKLIPTFDSDTLSFPTSVTAAMTKLFKSQQSVRSQQNPGRFWGFLGDSITNGSNASNFAYSFSSQAVTMVGATIALPGFVESGVPGQTSSAMLARVNDFIATGIDAAVLLAGTNDAGQGVTPTQFATNMTAIIKALRAESIPVVLCTTPAQGSSATAAARLLVEAYNTWIRISGPLLGARIADAYAVTADTTTGILAANKDSGDGVHPNDLGHQNIATVVARQMKDITNAKRPRGIIVSKTAGNGVADPLSARANAGDWFEFTGNNTGVTISFVTDIFAELPAGRWTQWDFDAAAGGGVRRFAVPGIANGTAGNRMVVASHVQIEDVSGTWEAHVAAGTASVGMSIVNADTLAGVTSPVGKTIGLRRTDNPAVYDVGPVVFPFDAPSGVTNLAIIFFVTLPTGDRVRVRAGAVGVLNATQLGIADQFAYSMVPINSPA